MTLSSDDAIGVFAQRMIDTSLPKDEWTHEGHFAVAQWLVRHRPDLAQDGEIRTVIMRYNEATNTPNTNMGGYHHTITVASMRVTREFLSGFLPDTPLHIVLGELMASRLGRPDWVLAHWRQETLFSPTARRIWVEPDLLQLSP